jgi:hypothetical protein
MRKVMTACIAALLAVVVVGTWAMTQTTAKSPIVGPAAMNPHDMMVNAKDLPVHDIVDAV